MKRNTMIPNRCRGINTSFKKPIPFVFIEFEFKSFHRFDPANYY